MSYQTAGTQDGMNFRVRVAITQNTKGYQFERTAEVSGPAGSATEGLDLAERLLVDAEQIARDDIQRCRANDAGAPS